MEPVEDQELIQEHTVAVKNPYIWGLGRRKTASARVRIKAGTGKMIVKL